MEIKKLKNVVKEKVCIYRYATSLQKTVLMILISFIVMIFGHLSYAAEAFKPSVIQPSSIIQKTPVGQKPSVGEFKIVTKSFSVEPSHPIMGQSLTFKGTVKNEGDGPSPSDTPIFVCCKALSGGPCQLGSDKLIVIHAISLSPGETYNFQESTSDKWPVGKYEFFAGNDVLFGTNGISVEVIVSPPRFEVPEYIQKKKIQQPESLGKERMLNPQPEPPLPTNIKVQPYLNPQPEPPGPNPDPTIIPQHMPVVR